MEEMEEENDRKHPLATNYAWLAGIIDGEGCFVATYTKDNWLQLKLMVAMTHLPTINHLGHLFGGTVLQETPRAKPNCKQSYRWQLGRKQGLATVIGLCMPYLVTKSRQAEVVLEMLDMSARLGPASRTRGMWKEKDFERREELYLELRRLNKRGTA